MRVVLDTNVVISGIFWSGHSKRILERWLRGELTLVLTLPILREYREVIGRMAGEEGAGLYAHWDRLLTELSELAEPKTLGNICRDPDDDKFLEAALGGKADILVSGDQDLLSLVNIQEIPIVSPAKAIKSYLE